MGTGGGFSGLVCRDGIGMGTVRRIAFRGSMMNTIFRHA